MRPDLRRGHPRSGRAPLAAGAWVEHRPGWLEDADVVFDCLLADVPWRAERRRMYDQVVAVPRLVAWFDAGDPLPHPVLDRARARISAELDPADGGPLVTAGMCLYRDGRDSVAWHGDTIGRGATHDTVVAIVSLGAARPLLLRPRGGGPSRRVLLGHGDLFVMGGSCQRTWEHAVPKMARDPGPRISVQFRPDGVR